jgi:hypothetical protein
MVAGLSGVAQRGPGGGRMMMDARMTAAMSRHPFIKIIHVATGVTKEVTQVLVSFCKAPLKNIVNKQGCVHHFNAKARDFNLHFKK